MKNKPEMKEDGKDLQRFQAILKTIVSVPKEKLKKEEDRQREEAKKKA